MAKVKKPNPVSVWQKARKAEKEMAGVPEGTYFARLIDAKLAEFDGKPRVLFRYMITDGELKGRVHSEWKNPEDEVQRPWILRRLRALSGGDEDLLQQIEDFDGDEELKELLKDITATHARIELKARESEDGQYVNVRATVFLDDQDGEDDELTLKDVATFAKNGKLPAEKPEKPGKKRKKPKDEDEENGDEDEEIEEDEDEENGDEDEEIEEDEENTANVGDNVSFEYEGVSCKGSIVKINEKKGTLRVKVKKGKPHVGTTVTISGEDAELMDD